MNCPDVQTGLCNVAAGRSVSLSPGLGNDRTGEFSWTPFETDVVVPCGLAVREGESRESVRKLVDIAVDTYSRDPGDLLRAMLKARPSEDRRSGRKVSFTVVYRPAPGSRPL